MLMGLLICLLFGAVLGQRYKVLVLLPAMALAVAVAIISALGSTFWQIVGAALVTVTAIQVGYVIGLVIRHFAVIARAHRLPSGSLATSMSARRATN
jgi:hypothetical protein